MCPCSGVRVASVKPWKTPENVNPHRFVRGHSGALVRRYELQSYARKLLTEESVAACHVRRIAACVEIHQPLEHPKPFYLGLKICQSVWQCPICASKITTRRRQEVERAVKQWESEGGMVLMATFTLQHTADDTLKELADLLIKASSTLKNGKLWKNFLKRHGILGYIRAMEVTWGPATGWHPHIHMLFFLRSHQSHEIQALEQWLQARWNHVIGRLGGWAHLQHGCQVSVDGSQLANYITKMGGAWRLSDELTRGHTKRGRGRSQERYQMVDLLSNYGRYDDQHAGERWVEYARYFKGKKQLIWSDGLKARFAIEEKSDAEISEEHEEHATLLALLSAQQWLYVLGNDARAEVLLSAEQGYEQLARFMERLGAPFPDAIP